MSLDVGADVESICSKCGDVWHVIVAKVEDKIAKVQCKECGGTHRYKAAGAAAKKKAAPKRRTKKTDVPNPETPLVEPDLTRPVRRYQVSESYQQSDQIDHPKFGVGVVEEVMSGKIQVWFPEGRKVLAAAKPVTSLEPGGRAGPLRGDS